MISDEITASACVKYMNPGSTGNTNPLITNLAGVFGVSSSSTGDQLNLYNGLNTNAGTPRTSRVTRMDLSDMWSGPSLLAILHSAQAVSHASFRKTAEKRTEEY